MTTAALAVLFALLIIATNERHTTMTIWTRSFWEATAERIIRGAVIGALLFLGDAVITSGQLNVFLVDWLQLFGYALGGAFLSLLFSIIGNAASKNGPAFIKSEQVVPPLPNDPAA